jgi:hypothetical protein
MSPATKATQVIINNIQTATEGRVYADMMMENILRRAQELVNTSGYVWDVALVKATKMYPLTQHCGVGAYGN